jgi:hypothetical protein
MNERAPPVPPRTLLLQLAATLLAGTVLTVAVVLPAEYNIDPTGFGALTGINRISAPLEITVEAAVTAPPEIVRVEPLPFREDVIRLEVGGLGSGGLGALEYKVTMTRGQSLSYSWTASSDVVFEFHGHTVSPEGDAPVLVMDYLKGQGSAGNGTLTAPIAGIHGWYLANPGFDPISVEIRLAGYYELSPGIMAIR